MENIKKMNDIAAIATAKVNELTAKGFIFNFGTMAGSQGDDFKVDLTKDGITYRVRVYREYRSGECAEVFEVSKYEQNFSDDSFSPIWNQDGEVVESHVWYRMENRNGYVYTDDADAFKNARELHYTRVANSRNNGSAKSVIAPEKVIEKIRAHRGYKRAQADDIKCVVRKNDERTGKTSYVVELKNLVSKTADRTLELN